ncbi:MAG: hypothetical protein JO140_00630 [Candidatus Eremiobacteraeota bacterium]|nr:hypothetical protein [Candidatus Eremiobacteraeota bacterium]
MRLPRILIVTHEHDDFDDGDYLLRTLAGFWMLRGYDVAYVAGLERWPDAEIAFLHVDLTVVPETYVAAARRYPIVINGAATDFRKRHVSRHLVRPGDGWTGPVIVKTDLNACGSSEIRLLRRTNNEPKDLPASFATFTDNKYPILRSASEVAPEIWEHPGLVVERFLPERDERGFWLRIWTFLGDRERCSRYLSYHPLVKGENIIAREPAQVPDELREARRRFGFDYGKFDFTICDGEVVLFDVNATPWAPPSVLPQLHVLNEELARGIDAWREKA